MPPPITAPRELAGSFRVTINANAGIGLARCGGGHF